MPSIEEKFNENLEKWKDHCRKSSFSSLIKDYLNCDAYRNIVAIGKDVLPLIRKAYDTEPKSDDRYSLREILSCAVQEIVGDEFRIPDWMRGKIKVIEKYTVKWLDENMDKYVKNKDVK